MSASGRQRPDAAIRQALEESAAVKRALADGAGDVIARVARTLIAAIRAGHKVILFGNGGSAADAEHIAAELIGRFGLPARPSIPAIALTVNTSVLTAVGNDFGYRAVFARQVESLARPGDVVIGISTSGNSPNVLAGVRAARERGARTVALTGGSGGSLAREVDIAVAVPSTNPQRVQEGHIVIGHILCGLVEAALYGPPRRRKMPQSGDGAIAPRGARGAIRSRAGAGATGPAGGRARKGRASASARSAPAARHPVHLS